MHRRDKTAERAQEETNVDLATRVAEIRFGRGRGRRRNAVAARRVCGLSGAPGQADRAVSGRRCGGCRRAPSGQCVDRQPRPAGGDRQSRRRRRRHRHGGERAFGSRRLYADGVALGLCRHARPLPQAAVRSGEGLRWRHHGGVGHLCARRQSRPAGQIRGRADRPRQGQSGQAHLCFGRRRVDRPSRQRVLQAHGGRRHPARVRTVAPRRGRPTSSAARST